MPKSVATRRHTTANAVAERRRAVDTVEWQSFDPLRRPVEPVDRCSVNPFYWHAERGAEHADDGVAAEHFRQQVLAGRTAWRAG